MQVKSLVSLGLSLGILSANSLPGFTQHLIPQDKQLKQSVQRLPNGNYFYGRSRSPNQTDVDYLVFRKRGNTAIGLSYRYRSEGYCIRGTINGNNINNVSREYVELGSGSRPQIRRGNPINLGSYNRLNFNQIPADSNANRRLQECIRLFGNRI